MCGEIFFSLGYLRIAQRLAVVVIEVANLEQISDVPPGKYCFYSKILGKVFSRALCVKSFRSVCGSNFAAKG